MFLNIYVTSFVLGTNIHLGTNLNLFINVNFSLFLGIQNEPEVYWLGSTRPFTTLSKFVGQFY
jgi:hypothetical protein